MSAFAGQAEGALRRERVVTCGPAVMGTVLGGGMGRCKAVGSLRGRLRPSVPHHPGMGCSEQAHKGSDVPPDSSQDSNLPPTKPMSPAGSLLHTGTRAGSAPHHPQCSWVPVGARRAPSHSAVLSQGRPRTGRGCCLPP